MLNDIFKPGKTEQGFPIPLCKIVCEINLVIKKPFTVLNFVCVFMFKEKNLDH